MSCVQVRLESSRVVTDENSCSLMSCQRRFESAAAGSNKMTVRQPVPVFARSTPVLSPSVINGFAELLTVFSARHCVLLAGTARVHVGSGQRLQRQPEQVVRPRSARAADVLLPNHGGGCSGCETLAFCMRRRHAGQVRLRIHQSFAALIPTGWRACTPNRGSARAHGTRRTRGYLHGGQEFLIIEGAGVTKRARSICMEHRLHSITAPTATPCTMRTCKVSQRGQAAPCS